MQLYLKYEELESNNIESQKNNLLILFAINKIALLLMCYLTITFLTITHESIKDASKLI